MKFESAVCFNNVPKGTGSRVSGRDRNAQGREGFMSSNIASTRAQKIKAKQEKANRNKKSRTAKG